jgi:lipoate-protein ligase A
MTLKLGPGDISKLPSSASKKTSTTTTSTIATTMAPSRGFNCLLRLRLRRCHQLSIRGYSIRHTEKTGWEAFERNVTDPKNKIQAYVSRLRDPYINLSIEHYLLQNTPSDSTILFLYINKPCVVIGRNQNPWVEVNLELLKQHPMKIELVRRRSGGGTVFHDEGNVNYSVICPTADFDRDKHAEMVVRALKDGEVGVKNARVNERHDIVLDTVGEDGVTRPLKVSGSAYKLTRLRALHHGTCLLSSYALGEIGQFLRSPAKSYITARGVDSVPSPITNVNIPQIHTFIKGVISQFVNMYGQVSHWDVGEEHAMGPEILKGVNELVSLDWVYGQTPQFEFSAPPTLDIGIDFTARHGAITEAKVDSRGDNERQSKIETLVGKKLVEIDWDKLLGVPSGMSEFFPAHIDGLVPANTVRPR